jgi:metal-dependent HD superfamily phosphatase/phosphodiesterase
MMTLQLDDSEQQALVELLERELPDLAHEIHHTDDRDYRQYLKERERLLERLLARVKGSASAVAGSMSEPQRQPYSI